MWIDTNTLTSDSVSELARKELLEYVSSEIEVLPNCQSRVLAESAMSCSSGLVMLKNAVEELNPSYLSSFNFTIANVYKMLRYIYRNELSGLDEIEADDQLLRKSAFVKTVAIVTFANLFDDLCDEKHTEFVPFTELLLLELEQIDGESRTLPNVETHHKGEQLITIMFSEVFTNLSREDKRALAVVFRHALNNQIHEYKLLSEMCKTQTSESTLQQLHYYNAVLAISSSMSVLFKIKSFAISDMRVMHNYLELVYFVDAIADVEIDRASGDFNPFLVEDFCLSLENMKTSIGSLKTIVQDLKVTLQSGNRGAGDNLFRFVLENLKNMIQ